MLVQVSWGHILFTVYLGIALFLTVLSYKYYLARPKRHPYPMLGALRFGLTWPITAPIAHAAMLQKWYRERTYRKWKKATLARQAATQKHS